MNIMQRLLELRDEKNAKFNARLIPTIEPKSILWTKIPVLRKLAQELKNSDERSGFLSQLPHQYLEENLLHWIFIEQEKDFWSAISKLEQFLPFIDNWEVCDIFSPKIFKRYPQETYQQIKIWTKSSHCYTVRYAIGLLLSNFLDQEFKPEMLDLVAKIKSEEYYIQMMQARYFATALAKQYEATIPLIESKILEPFVQNKTIQKARESRRISAETKEYLVQFKK